MMAVAMLAAGCAKDAPRPVNCAVRPPDFGSFVDPHRMISFEPPLINTVEVGRDGRLAWNMVPIVGPDGVSDWVVLNRYLSVSTQLEPQPLVTLVFSKGTSCTAVRRVRALMRRHVGCGPGEHCFQGPPR